MTAPLPSMPERPSTMKRWGPVIAIVAVVAVIGGVIALGGGEDETATGPDGTGSTGSAPTGAVAVPIHYEQAVEDGTAEDETWPASCDKETGRVAMPTVYAPPCVPEFQGDNGGATYQGVTADTIKIVNYVPSPDNDLMATLAGKTDTPEDEKATQDAYVAMLTDLYETYGRRIEITTFEGTGAADDETAARNDAKEVAEDIGAFASIGGPLLTGAYAEELANRGVLCFACGASNPDAKYQENAPFWWGSQASPEQFLLNLGDFAVKRLINRPAEFAGDALRGQDRVFGVVHFEQEVPVFGELTEEVNARGAEMGFSSAITETYTFDLPRMPERASSIISKLKESGVTTVIFLGDPIMPIYLTKAATAQDYYPEWILTGTVLTDTAALGRLYDQTQWTHAFGLSSLPARIPREQGDSWKLHEWYYSEPPLAANTQALVYPPVSQLLLGIHLAGPNLTPETFQAGMFGYPPTGGGPTTPRISYGDQGTFENPDYLGIDDMTLVWWDADEVGLDEQGKEGPGMYRYEQGGIRYLPGEIQAEGPGSFDEQDTVLIYDERPAEDQGPEYPSPERGAGCPDGVCLPEG